MLDDPGMQVPPFMHSREQFVSVDILRERTYNEQLLLYPLTTRCNIDSGRTVGSTLE